ncbi:flagellar biosynthetic protein FliO [Legionella cardiaca]|uniref:Flagellar protein n=1 Tax=Legionella cardiaca TaxID=1071983 RepID=A0ABY8AST2_9GAMM|nr:flagellar biosynthetic protein FliO [Legionella cardiaca]WED43745.1 flagellar biosynthetic protein FliO [Legionella cardiaca]
MRNRFYWVWVLFPVTTWANSKTSSTSSINNGELLRVMGGLLLVVGVIVFLSWLLRRLNSAGLGNTNGFKVMASMSLGTREKIMLVNIGNRFLLLGVTSGSIITLHDFGEELPTGFLLDTKTSFKDFLKTALGKS